MKIIGHETERNMLKKLFESKRLPHALLFNGDDGIGKKLIALEFAKSFYCENNVYGGCDNCNACKLFDESSIPDFYFIDCENKEEAKTENIRELLYNLSLKNFSSKNKFIIFDNAQYLKDQCSNILLKTLEEPKDNTFFILITSNFSTLPATILSRCHVWFFKNLKNKDIKNIIEENGKNCSEEIDIDLLEGSLSGIDFESENIFSIDKNEKIKLEASVDNILNGNEQEVFLLASMLSKDKEKIKNYLTILRNIIRKKMISEENNYLKAIFATTLENIIFSEHLVFNRYINFQNILINIFLNLVTPAKNTKNSNSIYDLTSIYN